MLSIRELRPNDASECAQIWADLESHYGHPMGGDWTLKKIQEELEAYSGLGAFDGEGKMEAFCLYRAAANITEIMCLATRLRVHRSGAMRVLIRSLIEDLGQDDRLWLEVHAGNLPAIGLYESLGFRMAGERKAYYKDGGKALLFEYKPLQ